MLEGPIRLTPTMSSRKLQLLGFIKRYYVEHGKSPSNREMVAYIDVGRSHLRTILRQLERDGDIIYERGRHRGVRLKAVIDQLSTTDALLLLQERGFTIDPGKPLTLAFPVPKPTLPIPPALDYVPDVESGDGDDELADGRAQRGGDGRPSAPARS